MIIQGITYFHPNKELLFDNISFSISLGEKNALIGNNGVGKSTLLNILAGLLEPTSGKIIADSKPYYIPQLFGQFNDYTISQALQIENKLSAYKEILNGNASEEYLLTLDDDWTIETRCQDALKYWNLEDLDLDLRLSLLSGGQKTKIFLAGIMIHQPEVVLLDEPSNHLDTTSRQLLYNYIVSTTSSLLIVSHDRHLLNLLSTTYELTKHQVNVFGGNYDFYAEQKELANMALSEDVRAKEKELRKSKEIERLTNERQQRRNSNAKKTIANAGLPTILQNTRKNAAENSSARLKGVHSDKISAISQELSSLRSELPDVDKMKFNFDNSHLHIGKMLVNAKDIEFSYGDKSIWNKPLTFNIASGDRIAIKGDNGSGKTTLLQIILGKLHINNGDIAIADFNAIYIDQEYSLIDEKLSIYEQTQRFNATNLQEHEIKIRLFRFLFDKESWDKPCSSLSGGEKMRLMLCLLNIHNQAPDVIILDEPTNNLDIQNIVILTAALNDYSGTLLVISHDEVFLNEIGVVDAIEL
ncbi:MAG: ATP-binding cassette domain-containing protein [Ignavibacteria bacterium]|jgi:ATPase subunit of ABC transporter with duplicated ATPase domains|nr:ATP-binding cassette domain-containing protein [Ignavibacteria bacterium]